MCIANSLTTSAQLSLPNWVRARGMSLYQIGLMTGSAVGAASWGLITDYTNVTIGLLASGIFGLLGLIFLHKIIIHNFLSDDSLPVCPLERPPSGSPIDPAIGPVMISIEYRVPTSNITEFKIVMKEIRQSRKRQGCISWSLFKDVENSEVYTENFAFSNWGDYLRRFDRFTSSDLALHERRDLLQINNQLPVVKRRVGFSIDA
jgi:hypothetical protein